MKGYTLINTIIMVAILFFQDNCPPKPVDECSSNSVKHTGDFGLCLSNGLPYDIDFFVIDQKGRTLPGLKNGSSTVIKKTDKQETNDIQFGDTLYFRAELKHDLSGLKLNFEDYLKTLSIESEFYKDSVHIKIKVDSVSKGPVLFHFPGHICLPSKPNCDDT